MGLLDIQTRSVLVIDEANKIREMLAQVINIAEMRLQDICTLVGKYGRANIAAEFGEDTQTLLTVYTKLKEAIEIATGKMVEDLP